ncbi:hypothetical protein [Paenibacillus sp. Y412MC10]|uniref:hypothetical protein n=1 Tax=Geobacillus sp. (strain Y412MC10) TaxID=481743 RepID=UPI0011AB2F91|nr:hypothetical protein [Paenibacillus sp. Y412MC10]
MEKEFAPLGPDKIGLSAKDIIYLIIFRELRKGPRIMRELYDAVVAEPVNLKSKSYIYQAIRDMEAFGWISCIEVIGMTKKMATTKAGVQKQEEFASEYLQTLQLLKNAADFFAFEITGTGRMEKPEWNDRALKHFNRIVNVRYLTRFLFMSILSHPQHKVDTVKNIYDLMKDRYGWQCGEGYIYELAHEMEDPSNGWIHGRWNSDRRHHYLFNLTPQGYEMIAKEREAALAFIRRLQTYTSNLLRLFPNSSGKGE